MDWTKGQRYLFLRSRVEPSSRKGVDLSWEAFPGNFHCEITYDLIVCIFVFYVGFVLWGPVGLGAGWLWVLRGARVLGLVGPVVVRGLGWCAGLLCCVPGLCSLCPALVRLVVFCVFCWVWWPLWLGCPCVALLALLL